MSVDVLFEDENRAVLIIEFQPNFTAMFNEYNSVHM
jgi:hypothetical protein